MWRKTLLPYMLTTLLLGLCCLASSRADVVMEMFRSANAALRNEIKNRAVAREKVVPTQNDSGILQVAVRASFGVLSVLSVDDARQRMVAAVLLRLQWRDPMLAWNLSEYAGVEYVELPVDAVWTPDIRIMNSYVEQYLVESTKTLFLHHTGEISVSLSVMAKVLCVMDHFDYPYDEQVCSVFFFSFSGFLNITSHLDLHSPAAIADVTSLSNEWTLTGTKLELFSMDGGRTVFPKLLIRLRRKTAFYTVCLVLPMMVTSYMNPLVFLLPLQCGEKVSFLVAIFLSTSVYFSYFTSVMPRGLDELPKVMAFLVGVLVQSVLTFLATILVLRLQNHPAPTINRHSCLHSPDLPLSLQTSSSDTSPTTTISTTASSESDAIPQDSTSTKFPRHHQRGDGKISTEEKAAPPAATSSVVVLWGRRLTLDRLEKAFFCFSFVGNTVFLICMYFMEKE